MLRNAVEVHEVERTQEVPCNKCGRSCRKGEEPWSGIESLDVVVNWGFFSSKDMETHRWQLCESCYDALIATFVIPPEIRTTEFTPVR